MQHLEPHNLIKASPLFRHMQPHEAEAILARLQPSYHSRGEHILERNIWHGRLYIIASGQVSVLLQDTEPDDAYTVARLESGECFGEMSLISGEPPGATIRVEQDTLLWSLSQSDFLTLVGTCPTLLQNINSILAQRLTRANQHFAATQAAEFFVLTLFMAADTQLLHETFSLAYHIAQALTARTRKRVLLLELCGQDTAHTRHFASVPGQCRSSLLACQQDRSQLQTHYTEHAQTVPALTTLADTQEQANSISTNALNMLADLSAHYDYILLLATEQTPPHIIQALLDKQSAPATYSIKQQIALVNATALSQYMAAPHFADTKTSTAVFIIHNAGEPTIAAQESYAQRLQQPVMRLLPTDDTLLAQSWQQQQALSHFAPQAALSRAVDFVARYIAQQTIGIAFGGGGARGFAHLGILDGLLAHDIPLDYIAACSSGIIASGMYLLGKSIAESEEIFLEIQRHIVQWHIPRSSIFSNRGLKRMLQELCGERRFEDLTVPFAMVAADLTTRAGVVLERGPLWHAGLASVALPGIFPPVILGKHILIDAGIHDPVPVRLVRSMGAHILLAAELGEQDPPALTSATPWLQEAEEAAHTGGKRTPTPHMVDLLLRSYDLAMATVGMHSIREADVVLRPRLQRISLRQFSEGRKFVHAGRENVEQMLPELRKRLPWL